MKTPRQNLVQVYRTDFDRNRLHSSHTVTFDKLDEIMRYGALLYIVRTLTFEKMGKIKTCGTFLYIVRTLIFAKMHKETMATNKWNRRSYPTQGNSSLGSATSHKRSRTSYDVSIRGYIKISGGQTKRGHALRYTVNTVTTTRI